MKKQILASLMALWAAAALADTTTSYTFSANQTVPDANPTGLTLSTNLTVSGGNITGLSITLNITNGFNGDLYAYLVGPNGGFAVLLNRVGVSNNASMFGYSDAGFDITLTDSGASDIHYYQSVANLVNVGGQLTGTWQPDGREINPMTNDSSAFLTAGQTASLDSFIGTDPNGTWTLFLADLSSGGNATLLGWGLNIVVPEPTTLAFGICGLGLLTAMRRKNR